MTSHKVQAFKPEQAGGGLQIGSLLGAPFVAAVNANHMMQQEQLKFLMEYCFTRNGSGFVPVMIEMQVKSVSQDGKQPTVESFEIPLLTLLPMNSLSVEDVKIKFEMEITSQSNVQNDQSTGNKASGKTSLKGVVSHESGERSTNSETKHYSKRNAAKMDVEMHAGTLPLPIGLTSILDAYLKSTQIKNKK